MDTSDFQSDAFFSSDGKCFLDVAISNLSYDVPENCNTVGLLQVSSWVIVQYALKKSKKHFGQVLGIVPEGLIVKFTRQAFDGFIWPDEED